MTEQADDQERLFGHPGAEHLYGDLDSAADAAHYPHAEPIVLEEWTVRDVRVSDSQIVWMLELLAEYGSEEGDEGYADAWSNAVTGDDVKATMRAACDLAASKVGYRMADKHVATWHAFSDGETWRFEKVEP